MHWDTAADWCCARRKLPELPCSGPVAAKLLCINSLGAFSGAAQNQVLLVAGTSLKGTAWPV